MKKSRWITLLALGLVLAGVAVGLGAYFSSQPAEAQAVTLPEPASWMPSTSRFVCYLDLASLASSPLGEQWQPSLHGQKGLDKLEQFREKTGMDPWTDFRALALFTEVTDGHDRWGLALTGDLLPERIVSAIEERTEVARQSHEGSALYLFGSPDNAEGGRRQAVAFPNPSTALFGAPDGVRAMLDVAAGRAGSVAEGPLAEWLSQLPLDETFWCVGGAEDGWGPFLPREHGEGSQLPPLESFAVSGSLDSELSMTAWARASDSEAARKLADVVRGFLALGSLQRQDRPEIQAVLDSVQIQLTDDTVQVFLNLPYETLRRLARAGEADR